MKDVLRTAQVRAERFRADRANENCLQASLLEASLAVGGRFANLDAVFSDSTINPAEVLNAVMTGSDVLGLEVARVLINEGLAERMEIPSELSDRVELVTGVVYGVKKPNIRGMLNKPSDDDVYFTHVECDDGSRRSSRRLAELEARGWGTRFIVELRKKD